MRQTILLLAFLAGCGSPRSEKPDDATLTRLRHAGDAAYNLERADEAASQYRAALARARQRDDAAAIADAGFNLATAELRSGHPHAARRIAGEMQAELGRRGIHDPAFALVMATALFRQDDMAGADQVASSLTSGATPELANAAWFLRGLIADARGDQAGLMRAAAALTPRADSADTVELRARLSHDPDLALRSADLRRDMLDYRGMARALALAARDSPPTTAADLYLRAGRSAAAQGDVARARLWLSEARQRGLRVEADRALHDLPSR